MKNELEINIRQLRLSKLEEHVLKIIIKKENIYNMDVASIVYKNKKNKPKCVSNGVTSAIRQINKKIKPYCIVGISLGRGGKLLTLIKK